MGKPTNHVISSECLSTYREKLASMQDTEECPYNLFEVEVFDLIARYIFYNDGKADYYDKETGSYGVFLTVEEIRSQFGDIPTSEQVVAAVKRLTGEYHKGKKEESDTGKADPRCRGKALKPLLKKAVRRPFFKKSSTSSFFTFADSQAYFIAYLAKRKAQRSSSDKKGNTLT